MDPDGKVMDLEGDSQLRGSYAANLARLMERAGLQPVKDIVDLGCATGMVLGKEALKWALRLPLSECLHASGAWRFGKESQLLLHALEIIGNPQTIMLMQCDTAVIKDTAMVTEQPSHGQNWHLHPMSSSHNQGAFSRHKFLALRTQDCHPGLSTLELRRGFPGAKLVGVDLSPYFLAVARHLQRLREHAAGGTSEPIR
jgi:SAM-dependent methyltransferase